MNKQTILSNSIKLREFINSSDDSELLYNTHAHMNATRNEPQYTTLTDQLNAINVQLIRIADALETANDK